MATQTETLVLDDIDNTPGATTLLFGLDGANYEIDLSPANLDAFRTVVEAMITKARRVDGKTKRKSSGSKPSSSEASKVREWARANGYTVGDRGRMPAEVIEAYAKAQS